MSKPNSVQWFLDKLIEHRIIIVDQTTYGDKVKPKHEILLEQAKAMHKEECIKYYVDSVDYGDMGQHIRESLIQIAEKMYNETFGGNND